MTRDADSGFLFVAYHEKSMNNEKDQKDKKGTGLQPDPETLHTTDPQKEMKGPVSSFMNNLKEGIDEEGRKVNPDPDETDNEPKK